MQRRTRVRSFVPCVGGSGIEALESRQLLSLQATPASFVAVPVAQPAQTAEVRLTHRPHGHHGHLGHHGHTPAHHGHNATAAGRNQGGSGGATPAATAATAPYTPAQIRHAYGVDQLAQTGAGQTIAIIDAYDDPTIANDLAVFSRQWGLPAANFVKAVPASGTPAYDAGWAGEISLDVEWAHAIAPGAKILLVEAASSSFDDLNSAVDYAVSQGARQISMSYGGQEASWSSSYDGHFAHPGIAFLASAGDSGAQVEYPAASPFVTAVGGTNLQLDTSGNRINETAWSGSGGGHSLYAGRPPYQRGFDPATGRGVPDVSYDADPNTGLYVYNSSSGGSWYQVGGTSAGAPQWAGLMALVNQGRAQVGKPSLGTGTNYGPNEILYAMAGGTSYTNARGDFFDVKAGSNGYSATTGYDFATGLGSPVANRLVPDLIRA